MSTGGFYLDEADQAVAHAIDKGARAELILAGLGIPLDAAPVRPWEIPEDVWLVSHVQPNGRCTTQVLARGGTT